MNQRSGCLVAIVDAFVEALGFVLGPNDRKSSSRKNDDQFNPESKARLTNSSVGFGHFAARNSLLTIGEKSFYDELSKAVEGKYHISAKPRLEDIVAYNGPKSEELGHRNRIKSRHVDFVLSDQEMRIVAAIELDDKSHGSPSAQINDEFKNRLFKSTKIPLIRFRAKSSYNHYEIARTIRLSLRQHPDNSSRTR